MSDYGFSEFAYTLTFSRYLLTVECSADARLDFKSRSVTNGKTWKQASSKVVEEDWDSHEKVVGVGSALTISRKVTHYPLVAAALDGMTS